MNKNQKTEYLKSPNHCPYCKSEDISANATEMDDTSAYSKVICGNCDRQWHDIYKLVDVEDIV